MPKYPRRPCGENLYHHIYAWGNDRNPIFKARNHFEKYIDMLERLSAKFSIDIIAYALMDWHIHLFIFDPKNKISKFMEELHGGYATFFNKETGRVGHVFGERYNNKIVQPNEYGLWLSRYIHRQAVEAGIVKDARDYIWTSYREYIGLEPIRFIKPWVILEQFGDPINDFKRVARKYEEFVVGEEIGKFDIHWEDLKTPVIGDFEFVNKLQGKTEMRKMPFLKELLYDVSNELKTTVDVLLEPAGHQQKRLRGEAINILYKRHKLKIFEIAKLLNVSRFTVMRCLEK